VQNRQFPGGEFGPLQCQRQDRVPDRVGDTVPDPLAARLRSGHAIDQLAKLISVHGAPRFIRSDYGSEVVSRAILKWLTEKRT
jgi:hypothetical protein